MSDLHPLTDLGAGFPYSDFFSCSAIPDFRFAFVQTHCQTPALFRANIKRSSDLKSCRTFSVSRLSFVHAHLSVPMSFRASPAAISDTVSCRRYAEGRLHFVQSYSQLPTQSRASPIPISDLLSCKLRLRLLAPNADCCAALCHFELKTARICNILCLSGTERRQGLW